MTERFTIAASSALPRDSKFYEEYGWTLLDRGRPVWSVLEDTSSINVAARFVDLLNDLMSKEEG